MAILFGSDVGVQQDSFGQVLDYFNSEYQTIKNGLINAFTKRMTTPPAPPKEKVFVDSGFSNVPGTSFVGSNLSSVDDIQTRQVTSQEPVLTLYIKKRAFRALRNENDLKFFDSGEKLFLRATKILFENKCQQIAAYEALTKASSLLNEESSLDYDRIASIVTVLKEYLDSSQQLSFSQIESLLEFSGVGVSSALAKANDIITQARADSEYWSSMIIGLEELQNKAGSLRHATRTNWVVDINQPDAFLVGRGSGVIELTMVTDLNTSLSLDGSVGTIGFTMQDPYNLTKITSDEIEVALSAAQAELDYPQRTRSYLGPQAYLDTAQRLDGQLKSLRKDRIANAFGLGQNSGNAILGGTDNTEIIFEINLSSSASNKVTASIGDGASFNENNFRIALLQLPIEQQLTPEENDLVIKIFFNLEGYVADLTRLNATYIENNNSYDTIHARRNLRVHYLGKTIVQPMDSVNVYIRGNTFKQDELIGPLSSFLNNSPFLRNFEQNDKVSDAMLEEEMKAMGIDGLDIPVEIYRTLRTDSLMRNAGTHVFGGIITTVSEDYSADNGTYTTQVSGASNMQWLEMSRVNRAPSLDQTQGLLEDPLTPFDIKVDEATGLPLDNPQLNKATQFFMDNDVINFNSGTNTGDKFSTNTHVQDYLTNGDGTTIPQYKHAPGVVYKWKQGIIVATRNVNLKTSLGDQEDQTQKLQREMGMTVINDPFSGQDAADIVSVLVTGYPHNYESFYENAMSVGTFNNNVQSNSPESYFHSFFDINRSQNRAFGNFQPFKTIRVDPKALHARLSEQNYLQNTSKELNKLRVDLAKLQDQRFVLGKSVEESTAIQGTEAGNALTDKQIKQQIELNRVLTSLDNRIKYSTSQINEKSKKFKESASAAPTKGLRLYGTDFALDFGGSNAESESESMKEKFKRLWLRNTILQFRPQYDCRLNFDTNLFIVGEEYDKDLDIEAFVVNMSQNISLWESQFKSPRDICSLVAKTLDFEFFCDAQGHLQFRPPRYNKVPLSLLLKLFLLDNREGRKLYPPFLSSLFKSRSKNVVDELEIVDLNIDIESALLGTQFADNDVSLIKSVVGTLGPESISTESVRAPSDLKVRGLAKFILDTRSTLRSKTGGAGVDPASDNDITAIEKEIIDINSPPNMSTNRLKHISQLAQLVSHKERLEDSKRKLDQQANTYDVTMPAGGIGNNPSPDMISPFSDLIEDDFNDYLGPNSSKRFIIYDDQIIRSNFTESCDNVICRVDVNGEQDLIGEGPGSIGQIPVLWAGATDFDLWRQYGYRSDGGISRPFFKNAETQCAPYAMMLLNQNRKKAVKGSVTLCGNEYYQLGDVVYINSRDTLYYVTSVSHAFSYAGSFTTTLALEMGHPLGEYIPTPLDVIGKGIIKTQRKFNKVMSSRQTAGKQLGRHLATIIFPNTVSDSGEQVSMMSGDFASFNVNEIKNALSIASLYLGENKAESYPKIEVRGFTTNEDNNDKVLQRIDAVINILKCPAGKFSQTSGTFAKLNRKYFNMAIQDKQFNYPSTEPVLITGDMNESKNSLRCPKEEVFSLVGQNIENIENIIEIVLVFKDPEK